MRDPCLIIHSDWKLHVKLLEGTPPVNIKREIEMTDADSLWFWDETRWITRFDLCILLGFYGKINPHLWGTP